METGNVRVFNVVLKEFWFRLIGIAQHLEHRLDKVYLRMYFACKFFYILKLRKKVGECRINVALNWH